MKRFVGCLCSCVSRDIMKWMPTRVRVVKSGGKGESSSADKGDNEWYSLAATLCPLINHVII